MAAPARQTAPGETTGWGPLLVVDDAVYASRWRFDGGSDLLALDAASGEERWRVPVPGRLFAAPLLADGSLYVGDDPFTVTVSAASPVAALRALDPATGAERWRAAGVVDPLGPPAVFADLLVVRSLAETAAFDAATGRRRWSGALGLEVPVVGDAILVYEGNPAGLFAVEAATGEDRWTIAPPRAALRPVAISGGLLFAAGGDDRLRAIDPATGGLLGTTAEPAALALGRSPAG